MLPFVDFLQIVCRSLSTCSFAYYGVSSDNEKGALFRSRACLQSSRERNTTSDEKRLASYVARRLEQRTMAATRTVAAATKALDRKA